MTSNEIQRWADAQQYASEPMPLAAQAGITVTLLNATPDPLGTLAALCGTYKGVVIRDLSEVTDDERRKALKDMMSTILSGPLAGIQFHFLIEGASRSFTHQAVRDNFSFIAQESLRFAVKEDWAHEIPLPPSLAGLKDDDPRVRMWRKAMNGAEDAYGALVAAGMPAEEARDLLPHAVTTRYHWTPTLRTLLYEAGKRTCTQAQFHWRRMFAQIALQLRNYTSSRCSCAQPNCVNDFDNWQFALIADYLRPICYQTGKCEFKATFDRHCSIRDRVEANARLGRPSSEWHESVEKERCIADSDCPGGCGMEETYTVVEAIELSEWAADPWAARLPEVPCPRCKGSKRVNYSSGGTVYTNAIECPDCKGSGVSS